MSNFEYLDPERTLLVFDGYKLNRHCENKNGSVRWRCKKCKSKSITIDSNGELSRKVAKNSQHKHGICEKYNPIQILCFKQYERLKHEAKTSDKFTFSERYRALLLELQEENDPAYVANHFISEETARVTCSRIRTKISVNEAGESHKLEVLEEQKFIKINNEKQLFLRIDNQNKNGESIMMFISDTAIEILQRAEEYHIDATFKNCPKQFYQILTVHAVIDDRSYPCAYTFLESKNTSTYVIALEQLRNICFPKNLKRVMVDFEASLMKSVVSVFPGIELKGCWFHFTLFRTMMKNCCRT